MFDGTRAPARLALRVSATFIVCVGHPQISSESTRASLKPMTFAPASRLQRIRLKAVELVHAAGISEGQAFWLLA